MKRLTTDNPRNNFETAMNFVYGKDGWAVVRNVGKKEDVPLTQWAKEQCIQKGCIAFNNLESPDVIDETICSCMMYFPDCPVALAYCFASQACHLRSRLKLYEDTNLTPEEIMGLCSMHERAKMAELLRMEENRPLTIDELGKMDGEPVYLSPGDCYVLVSHNGFVPVFSWKDGSSCSACDWYTQVGPAYRRKPKEGTP